MEVKLQVMTVAGPRNQHLSKAEKNTHTAIRPDGGFLFLGGVVAMAGSTIFVSEVAHEL